MKLATSGRATPLEPYRDHVLHVIEAIDRCRFAGSDRWQIYRAFLAQEIAAISAPRAALG
jgi:hypothetical protein